MVFCCSCCCSCRICICQIVVVVVVLVVVVVVAVAVVVDVVSWFIIQGSSQRKIGDYENLFTFLFGFNLFGWWLVGSWWLVVRQE